MILSYLLASIIILFENYQYGTKDHSKNWYSYDKNFHYMRVLWNLNENRLISNIYSVYDK